MNQHTANQLAGAGITRRRFAARKDASKYGKSFDPHRTRPG
jgi:hypothetical protein